MIHHHRHLGIIDRRICTYCCGERAGAKLLLSRIKKILVDKGYSGAEMTDWGKDKFNWIWEASKSSDNQKELIPELKREPSHG